MRVIDNDGELLPRIDGFKTSRDAGDGGQGRQRPLPIQSGRAGHAERCQGIRDIEAAAQTKLQWLLPGAVDADPKADPRRRGPDAGRAQSRCLLDAVSDDLSSRELREALSVRVVEIDDGAKRFLRVGGIVDEQPRFRLEVLLQRAVEVEVVL